MPTPRNAHAIVSVTIPLGRPEQHQSRREHDIGNCKHATPPMLVNCATDHGTEKGRHQKRTGENPEHDCPGQAETRSYGIGEDRGQIIARCPGQRLRRAERGYNDRALHPA